MKRIIMALAMLAGLALPASAQAWTGNHFYSASRKTECRYMPDNTGDNHYMAYIACENFRTGQVAVIYRTGQAVNATSIINKRIFSRYGTGHTLDYGQTYDSGVKLRCYAQTDADASSFGPAMECWSRISGHGFLINVNGIRRF